MIVSSEDLFMLKIVSSYLRAREDVNQTHTHSQLVNKDVLFTLFFPFRASVQLLVPDLDPHIFVFLHRQ
jgi:hypothetical protein